MSGVSSMCDSASLRSSSTVRRHWRKAGQEPLCEKKLPDINTASLVFALWPSLQTGNAVDHRTIKTII